MKIYKACGSGIGGGLEIKYRIIHFDSNMQVISPFAGTISDRSSSTIPKGYIKFLILYFNLSFFISRRADRQHHHLLFCPVGNCTMTFETNKELGAHITIDLHIIPEDVPITINDIARIHLTELLRTTSLQPKTEAQAILQHQSADGCDVSSSFYYKFVSHYGWALRTRKIGKPMSDKEKDFIEQLWLDSIRNDSRITPENIQQQIRTKRDSNGAKIFQTTDYPTKNQIKYQFRKLNRKYDLSVQQQLIAEIIDECTQPQSTAYLKLNGIRRNKMDVKYSSLF